MTGSSPTLKTIGIVEVAALAARAQSYTHPKPEIVTVISGTIRLGMGTSADQSKAQPVPAGSFFALPPGMAHYVFADGDTVLCSWLAGTPST